MYLETDFADLYFCYQCSSALTPTSRQTSDFSDFFFRARQLTFLIFIFVDSVQTLAPQPLARQLCSPEERPSLPLLEDGRV